MEKISKKTRGLGKGLNELLAATLGGHSAHSLGNSLISSSESEIDFLPSEASDKIRQGGFKILRVEKLNPGPFQPRLSVKQEGIEQLAESIRIQGVLQPIVVRKKDTGLDEYEIVAGERRWRAAQLAGLYEIPVIVKEITDQVAFAVALVENIQRENLNPIEEARALKRLADELALTHLQVAEAVGKSRTGVTNLLRLLTLNEDVQALLDEGSFEMGHARALLGVKGALQSQLAKTVVSRQLSVRETERLVQRLQSEPEKKSEVKNNDPDVSRLLKDLTDKLGSRVAIRHGQKGRGMLVIHYNNTDELEGILSHIN